MARDVKSQGLGAFLCQQGFPFGVGFVDFVGHVRAFWG
jgi:hypothetical protein